MLLEYRPEDVRLEVADNGIGFDPYADPRRPPTREQGFGLRSVQERARLLHGHVEIRSSPGVGTEIVAVIPIEPPASSPIPLAQTESRASDLSDARNPIRVLIVDDHELVRTGIRRILEDAKEIEVVGEAGDGEAALVLADTVSPDVTLLDVRLPDLDGITVLRRMKERQYATRVILLSVFAKDEQIFEGIRAGARGYLVKDTRPEELVRAIVTVDQGGSMLPPVIADRLVNRLDDVSNSQLTVRELDVLSQLAAGARNSEIATHLSVSGSTVKFHIANLFQKLNVHTRTAAVRVAGERGILTT